MKNRVIKVLIILGIAILITVTMAELIEVFATVTDFPGIEPPGSAGVVELGTILGAILTVIRIAGVGVAIIIITVLAMKYMMASPGDKADIKKHAVPYVIGAVVLMAASGIVGLLQVFVSDATTA